MTPKHGQALMLLLGRKGSSPPPASEDSKGTDDKDGASYDEDLKMALADLAAALGVTLKDPAKAVDAVKTIHDLCDRASPDEG